MRYRIITLVIVILALLSFTAVARASGVQDIPILNQTSLSPQPWPELAPVPDGKTVYITTSYSYQCEWVAAGITCDRLVSAPDPAVLWRRDYAGVFSASHIGSHTLLFIHGENKNQVVNGVYSHNTVTPDTTCWAGYINGAWQDCWYDYFAFASVTLDGRDLGPIVWPSKGYLLPSGKAATDGIRHPTSIVANGYVWVFYCDTSNGGSIAVARAPISSYGRPGAYRTWTGTGWQPSLPKGFTAAHASRFLHSPGPAAAQIAPGSWFAVTRVGSLFVGYSYGWLTSGRWNGNFGTQVWVSSDLVHWTPQDQYWVSSNYGDSTVRYPRPVASTTALGTDGTHVQYLTW